MHWGGSRWAGTTWGPLQGLCAHACDADTVTPACTIHMPHTKLLGMHHRRLTSSANLLSTVLHGLRAAGA